VRKKTKHEGVFYRELKSRDGARPDRTFEFCYSEAGRKRWKTCGRASEGATAASAARERLALLGCLGGQAVPTVRQAGEEYLAGMGDRASRPSMASALGRHVYPALGGRRLDEVGPAEAEALKLSLMARGRPRTAQGVLRYLSSIFFRACRVRGLALRNPFSREAGFRIPRHEGKSERWLTAEEAGRLLARLREESPVWADMALISLHTGLRLSELWRIRGQDVAPGAGALTVSGKNGRREAVPLTPEAERALLRRPAEPGAFVFPRGSEPFYRAVRAAGLDPPGADRAHRVVFHTLRHTFASWLAQAGVDLYTIQKLMRHASPVMTQRYAHLIPGRARDCLDVLRSQAPGPDSLSLSSSASEAWT
jgi:integrase